MPDNIQDDINKSVTDAKTDVANTVVEAKTTIDNTADIAKSKVNNVVTQVNNDLKKTEEGALDAGESLKEIPTFIKVAVVVVFVVILSVVLFVFK